MTSCIFLTNHSSISWGSPVSPRLAYLSTGTVSRSYHVRRNAPLERREYCRCQAARMADEPPKKKAKVANSDSLPPCPYGARCYRKNPQHLKEFFHPTKTSKDSSDDKTSTDSDSDNTSVVASSSKVDTSSLPPCKYGAGCYRKNLIHFAEYSHPSDPKNNPSSDADTGSDTDPISDDSDGENEGKAKDSDILRRGVSLVKKYSQMTEEERKELIKKAFEAKQQLQKELEKTKKKVEEKEKELDKMQHQINRGALLMEGEKEVLEKNQVKHYDLYAERSYKEGSAAQTHFRLAESQFYRLLTGPVSHTSYRVTKVEYVVNSKLVKRFREAREALKKKREEAMSYPVLAFHGTQEKNIDLIVKDGFLVPGESGFKHATDTGFYGKGVYFSEYPSYSMSYIHGSLKLLLCQVLVGKPFQCSSLIHGKPLMSGYDSHVSPDKYELIIFNSHRILPCYIVHYKDAAKHGQIIYTPTDNDDVVQRFHEALAAKKTNVFKNQVICFSGKMVETRRKLELLVQKHGGKTCTTAVKSMTILITTKAEVNSPTTKVNKAIENNVSLLSEDFLYESIIKKKLEATEKYDLK